MYVVVIQETTKQADGEEVSDWSHLMRTLSFKRLHDYKCRLYWYSPVRIRNRYNNIFEKRPNQSVIIFLTCKVKTLGSKIER